MILAGRPTLGYLAMQLCSSCTPLRSAMRGVGSRGDAAHHSALRRYGDAGNAALPEAARENRGRCDFPPSKTTAAHQHYGRESRIHR